MHALIPALQIHGLAKAFDGFLAVNGLDLVVPAGQIYALLGPNGAGKTTTLRMVTGLARPDAGDISVFGVDALADPIAAKRLIAWLPDEPLLYDKLTPLEYLAFIAGLWKVPAAAAEPLTGLDAAAARSVKDILLEQVAAGGTVILTTHILEVAERIAQRIGIIRAGRLVAEGSMAELSAGRAEGTTLEQLFLELAQEDVPA
jgi:ABC-2 type transport system ATP-binding protein